MYLTERLARAGIVLPAPPTPAGLYRPAVCVGDLIFTAGHIAFDANVIRFPGRVPSICGPEDAKAGARLCAINMLAAAQEAVDGDIDRIVGCVKLDVFVQSEDSFIGQAEIANGASEFFVEIFGVAGCAARTVIGVSVLALNASVVVSGVLVLAPCERRGRSRS